ncbi:hypothetical protein GEMRC1_003764 [Eukaryota sp. GEM-RC1]
MPIGKGKGGKHRRRGKAGEPFKRELIVKEPGQEYAQCQKLLGNARVEVTCFPSQRKRLAHIRGKLRKRCWMRVSDIVLVSLREFQDNKVDIVHKYNDDEIRALKRWEKYQKENDMVQFADDEDLEQDFKGDLPLSDDDMFPSSEEEEDIHDLDDAIAEL